MMQGIGEDPHALGLAVPYHGWVVAGERALDRLVERVDGIEADEVILVLTDNGALAITGTCRACDARLFDLRRNTERGRIDRSGDAVASGHGAGMAGIDDGPHEGAFGTDRVKLLAEFIIDKCILD